MKKILFIICAALTAVQAWAYDFESNGICYNIKNNTAVVTYQVFMNTTNYAGLTDVVIPATVTYNGKTYNVTSIGNLAFAKSSIKSVSIPSTMTEINTSAFTGCEIESLTLNTANVGTAFNYMESIKTLTLNNGTENLAKEALEGCAIENLNFNITTNVHYSTPVRELFSGSTMLKSVTFGEGVTTIPEYLFWYCTNLETVNFSSTITTIENYAFSHAGLKKVILPEGVTEVQSYAFEYCGNLKEVSLPSTLVWEPTAIGNSNLNGFYPQHSIGSNDIFHKCPIETATINTNNIQSANEPNAIGNIAIMHHIDWFTNMTTLKTVIFGTAVQKIPGSMFRGCTNLNNIIIQNPQTTLGGNETDLVPPFKDCINGTIIFAGSSISDWGNRYQPCTVIRNTVLGDDGFAYTIINSSTHTIQLSAYAATVINKSGATSFEIPSTVSIKGVNYTVTSIAGEAFKGCDKLQTVTIPNTVKSIGDNAFSGCSMLTSASLPNGVQTIGQQAFSGCSSLREVTIPSTVTVIGANAFGGCYAIETLVVNSNNIGTVFNDIESLRNVTFGDNVTSLDNNAFKGCNNIENVYYNSNIPLPACKNLTIGDNITSIGDYMFYENDYLESVTIGNGVTSIGENAFNDCYNLRTVNMGNSVVTIGNEAFEYCDNLTSVNIPNSVISIGDYAFSCHLPAISVPSTVTTIGRYAFSGVKNLEYHGSATYANNNLYWGAITYNTTPDENGFVYEDTQKTILKAYVGKNSNVVIPNTVKTIKSGAFSWLDHITSVTIPGSVETIEGSTFSDCPNLTSITIPGSVKTIETYAFIRCYGLKSVTLQNGVETINDAAFRDCKQLTTVSLPNTLITIGSRAFSYCNSLESIVIPNSVTTLGYEAFYECTNLTSIEIPNSVTSIGTYAFARCTSLARITIPSNLTTIAEYTFAGCSNLGGFIINNKYTTTLHNKITTINRYAFSGCKNLTSISIPNTVSNMGEKVFNECANTKVYCDFTENQSGWNANWAGDATPIFYGQEGYCIFYNDIKYQIKASNEVIVKGRVGNNKIDIVIPATFTINGTKYTVTEFGAKIPLGDSLSSLTLPNTITTIGNFAITYPFTVEIPSSVTTLSYASFSNCAHIIFPTADNLPYSIARYKPWGARCLNGVQDGDFLYSDNTKKKICFYTGTSKNVQIPNGVETIGYAAFAYLKNIESVSIPSSVTTIEEYAFGESSLRTLNVPSSVTTIGKNAFRYIPVVNYSGSATYDDNNQYWGALCLNTAVTAGDFIYADNTRKKIVLYIGNGGNVVIPNGVETIGQRAFYKCLNLTSITIPESVKKIESTAFYGCEELGATNLPNSITSIGASAFALCHNIVVTIPENLTELGGEAFGYCYALTDVKIPATITTIPDNLFYQCRNLKSVTIPNTITSIGQYAFYYCKNLTSVNIPNTVTEIKYGAFEGCDKLESVSIPNSVTTIGRYAFKDCNNATLYCQASSKPTNWEDDFADGVKNVVWGCLLVTANSTNTSQGIVTGGGLYAKNSRATLTAVPSEGYHFTKWNNNVDWSPYKIAVSDNITLSASFAINTYNLVATGANGKVTVTGTANSDGTYNHGRQITLEATADNNYHFVKWSNGVTTANYTLNLVSDSVITAVFEGNAKTVASAATSTNGTVDGAGTYAYGSEATLTANPAANYHFVQWSNGVKANPYALKVAGDTTVNAVFAINTFNAMAATEADGTVSAGRAIVAYGDTTKFTATPIANYHLARWSDGSTANPYIVTITSDTLLIAEFEINTYAINASAEHGTVTGTGNYTYGTPITLTASAATGYEFTKWSDNVTTATREVLVTSDSLFTAIFAPIEYDVTIGTDEHGYVKGDKSGKYLLGTVINLTAKANNGYHFAGWSDNNTDNPREITVNGPLNLTAKFAKNNYTISLTAEHGTITGAAESYEYASTFEITAIPDAGYHFTKWSDGNTNNPRTIQITAELVMNLKTQELSFSAIFEADGGSQPTAIDEQAAALNIFAHGNTIVVENADAEIRIYDAMGRLVDRDVDNLMRAEFTMTTEGIYIVKVGNTVKRVMVNE